MKSGGSEKHIVISLVLLVIASIALHVTVFTKKVRADIDKVHTDIADVKRRVKEVGGTESAVFQQLEMQKKQNYQNWRSLIGHGAATQQKAEALRLFAELCHKNSVQFVEETGAQDKGAGFMDPRLKKIEKRLKTKFKMQPEVREVYLRGTYGSVLKVLKEVSQKPYLIVPLALNMKKDKMDKSQCEWVLLLWI